MNPQLSACIINMGSVMGGTGSSYCAAKFMTGQVLSPNGGFVMSQ